MSDVCCYEAHETLKHEHWFELAFVGHQPAGCPGGADMELRNCPCGSTLAMTCCLTDEQREAARADIDRRHAEVQAAIAAALARAA